MQRDVRLRGLSREHHHALVLARRAERDADGSDDEVASSWAVVRESFAAELEPHFEIEERLLLVPLAACGEQALVARTRSDHERLRALVAASTNADGARERLREFGELLRLHVRFEESELFPASEARLDAEQLAAVAAAAS